MYLGMSIKNRVIKGGKPSILIIGDSISHNTFPYLEDSLSAGYALHQPHESAKNTRLGLQRIDWWLSIKPRWYLVVFNWGLHDLKRPDRESPNVVGLDEYSKNLESLTKKILNKADQVLFVTTTHVPKKSSNRLSEDVEVYNAAARDVVARYNISVCDLYSCSIQIKDFHINCEKERNVHYVPEGYARLAEYVRKTLKSTFKIS